MNPLAKAHLFIMGVISCSIAQQAPQLSLWGKVADLTSLCSHWTLNSRVSVPSLQEFTVCLKFKLMTVGGTWTIFMYRHPDIQYTELGFGGRWGRLVVWLFGETWTTSPVNLERFAWYSMCLTWSDTKHKPALYVNGNPTTILTVNSFNATNSSWPSCCALAPNGTLTLGASHFLANGNIQILPKTRLFGQISLFRLWGRERSKDEVTSLYCTEGQVVKWERDHWDTLLCEPVSDPSLNCEWSLFRVEVLMAILRQDGNTTDLLMARNITQNWLLDVLPANIDVRSLSLVEVFRSRDADIFRTTSFTSPRWANPNINRFDCLIEVEIIPGLDVATMQTHMQWYLQAPYNEAGLLQLLVQTDGIHTTAIESFLFATDSPPHGTTTASTYTTAVNQETPTGTITSTNAMTTLATTIDPTTTTKTTPPSTTIRSTAPTTATLLTTTWQTPHISTTFPRTTTSTTRERTTKTSTPAPPTAPTITTTPIKTTTIPPFSTSMASTSQKHIPVAELYFEVQVNVSITGDGDTEQILHSWLNTSLPDDQMTVIDYQLISDIKQASRRNSPAQEDVSPPGRVRFKSFSQWSHEILGQEEAVAVFTEIPLTVSSESCVFQVQVLMSHAHTEEMEAQIRTLLMMPYYNGSISIATEDIQISRILSFMCEAESLQTLRGLFEWPPTSGGKNSSQLCPKNHGSYATRHCKLRLSTEWMDADVRSCPLVVETILDLDDVEVTAGNAMDVVEMIKSLIQGHSKLSHHELDMILDKLKDVVSAGAVSTALGQAVIEIISDILETETDLLLFTNTILNLTQAVGDTMVGYEGSSSLVAPAVAVSVVDVDPVHFSGLTFGVSSDQNGSKPEIHINSFPLNSTVAFISLPSVLQESFPKVSNKTRPRIQFQFYGIPFLFQTNHKYQMLNSYVVSASVTNATAPIRDLQEDIKITFRHIHPNEKNQDIKCVYWDFNENNAHGGWDGSGCRKHNSTRDYTTCLCDHLTHFGILMDVSRTELDPATEQVLTIISYIGCGFSALFLGITVLTYSAFEKLRRDYPSQILLNLSLSLLGLNLVFLLNSWLSSWGLYSLCMATAVTQHYFLLASISWMGLEGVNMYFALVKVFNVYVPSYMLKFCVLGWGLPLVVCVLVLVSNREAYGSQASNKLHTILRPFEDSEDFCWIQDEVTFYVSVVAYALIVFLVNISVFIVVLIQIRHMQVNSPVGAKSGLLHDLKGVASLTLLLGLTWMIGFFTFGPARVFLLYLFAALNTLQGTFIFFFHCLMKENVRKQWRVHLCFGRFRLDEYSEWSHTGSVGAVAKHRPTLPKQSAPSVHSVKSSSTDSTSASSGSFQGDLSCTRPNLGVLMGSVVLPRAQRHPSSVGAASFQMDTNTTAGWRNHLLTQQGRT